MGLSKFLFAAIMVMILAPQLFAQETEEVAVTLKDISPLVSRLTWTEALPKACGDEITYLVFRGTTEDFKPSEENRIASGIVVTHYVAHEPKGEQDYYYRVIAVRKPGYCAPPALRSGFVLTYPLDLGGRYTVTVGDKTEVCKASSTAELDCKSLPSFHAVVASQGGHEFLIGCISSDYESNNWTCVNLKLGSYSIAVHSLTATILNSGFSKINTKTGKGLGPITPEFSVLDVLK
jgi:hypothetical protein